MNHEPHPPSRVPVTPSFATLLAAALLAPVPLAAAPILQQAPEAPEDSVVAVSELVVTVARVPTSRDASTASVTVVTGEELRERGHTSLADALRQVAGASIARNGSLGSTASLFMRGGNSGYVRVLVDGVPVNEPGGAIDLAGMTTHGIERIEVVRGGTSVLYGSDAVTGVIQIFTRGGGPTRLSAEVSGGSHGTFDVLAGGRGTVGRASWSLSAARETTDGTLTTDGVHPLDNSYRNASVNGHFGFAPDDRTDARVSLVWNDGRYRFPTDGSGRLVRDGLQQRERLALGVNAGRRLSDRLELRLGISHFDLDSEISDRPAAFSGADDSFHNERHAERRSAEVLANYTLRAATVVTLGAVVESQREASNGVSESSFGVFADTLEASRTNRAYFAQVLGRVADRLDIQTGVRVEDNEAFGTFVTYRGAAVVRLTRDTRVRASLGTSFKEPTFIENFSSGFSYGNPELDPERSIGWDVAVARRFGGRVELSAGWFGHRFRDLIQYDGGVEFGEPNYYNVAGASSSGFELLASADVGRGVSVAADYTYLRTRVTDAGNADPATAGEGTRLLRRPRHEGSVTVTYRFAERGSALVFVHHVGERDDLDFSDFPSVRVTLPAYTRVDAAATVPVTRGLGTLPSLAATLRLKNVLDVDYEEIFGFQAPGRQLFVGVRLGDR